MKRSSNPNTGPAVAADTDAANTGAGKRRGRMQALALAAALCCLGALLGFGAALEGYSHRLHPPGLLGADGIAHAAAFNLLGFMVPGLLLAVVAWRLRERLRSAGAMARIGAWLWCLSALAWAAQGGLALDSTDLDAPASRLHATAWMLWWLAFVAGAALLAIGARGLQAWRGLISVEVLSGALVLVAVLGADIGVLPAPIAQRLALLIWLVAYVATARGERPGN
ncbi:putative membrane protein [Lysobacter antibioticus]|uniref:DUF998 domain-containing protein n=1 Tax=Lysobacter antibioticus TaxID=84531 RepID=UPI000722CF2F|nr:DUF998 domain-containing protein [Lysobacter antibioticus]ALN64021.1 putative membrane protein [Lysobacter antibioticus]